MFQYMCITTHVYVLSRPYIFLLGLLGGDHALFVGCRGCCRATPATTAREWQAPASQSVQLFADDFEGDSLVHFLDASTGEFKASKSGGLATPDTVAIGFLDRYFIGVTSQDITVWDLVTDMIKYRAGSPVRISSLPSPSTPPMALSR